MHLRREQAQHVLVLFDLYVGDHKCQHAAGLDSDVRQRRLPAQLHLSE